MQDIKKLIDLLKDKKKIYIQTHDFPDHDAVGAALGLQYLLEKFKITSRIIFEGTIQRSSLIDFIDILKIEIKHAAEYPVVKNDKIVIVDGCKGNKNVTDLLGDEVAVIDHHQSISPDDVPYSDIRPEYGACCSIIYSYFSDLELEIPQRIATALLAGIRMDTKNLLRKVSEYDITAHSNLYMKANNIFVNANLHNSMELKDLEFFRQAIDGSQIKNKHAFCYFEHGCNQNLLGIIGDFILALKEVEFVLLCAKNSGKINLSLRNENPGWNAARIVQELVRGKGFGGGHSDMAGGIIRDSRHFNPQELLDKLETILYSTPTLGVSTIDK